MHNGLELVLPYGTHSTLKFILDYVSKNYPIRTLFLGFAIQ